MDNFLVLHPHHKLHYFKTARWEDNWIEMAHSILCEEFNRTYEFMDLDDKIVMTNKVWKNQCGHQVASLHLY